MDFCPSKSKLAVLAMGILLAPLVWAQDAGDSNGAGRARARDRAEERQEWFLSGRTARGEIAADLLHRAYVRKMVMRERAAASPNLEPADTPGFPQLVWSSLGPSPIDSDPTGFQSYGPVTGRVTAIAVDQKDPSGNTVYVGAAYGGVWKSSNAASGDPNSVTWQSVFDDQPTLSVGAIAHQPNGEVLLVGTGESNGSADSYYGMGIMRSTNGGLSWTTVSSANNGTRPLRGLGFSSIAFSTTNTNLVVAAAASTNGASNGAEIQGAAGRGLYVSSDAGQSWTYASVFDSGIAITPGSATEVIHNPAHGKFYAVIRFHGYYESTDGTVWNRMANQPGAALSAANCPALTNTATCAMVRGRLTTRADNGEMFAAWVNASGGGSIFKLSDNGGTWQPLGQAGIDSCGDAGTFTGCGFQQGTYNLTLHAVLNGTSTDLYMGAVNIFKCSVSVLDPLCTATGAWKNLTHVYGCSPIGAPAHVHPDQHGIDHSVSNPARIYFGNDGGVYRSLNSYGLNSSSCASVNAFENLNATLGSLSQFVNFAQHPNDEAIVLGGLQDNGSPAFHAANAGSGTLWRVTNLGDGGHNAIDPNSANTFYTSYPTGQGVNIERCFSGVDCRQNTWNLVAGPSSFANDGAAFYMPYMLDPRAPTSLLAGTCRVWRGPASGGSFSAISDNFSQSGVGPCSGGTFSGESKVRVLAAGGPATPTGGSSVIYAGMVGRSGGAPGKIFATTSADDGPSSWQDRTGNINPSQYDISDIAISPHDASGNTAYVSIMGFGVAHIFKTSNGGLNWTDKSGNLPDVPVNAIAVDPTNSSLLYVGTDIGVFISADDGGTWTELGSGLPNVAVVKVRTFTSGNARKLRAATYGRGLWQVDLPVIGVSVLPESLTLGGTVVGRIGQAYATVFSNNSSTPLSISGTITTGNFSVVHDCPAVVLVGASCTLRVSFAPLSIGLENGSLNIQYTLGTKTILLSATGIDFQFSLTRSSRPSRHGNASVAVRAGESAVIDLQLQMTPGADLDTVLAEMKFSCNGAPRNSRCFVKPGRAVSGGQTVPIQVIFQTEKGPRPARRSKRLAPASATATGTYRLLVEAALGTAKRVVEVNVEVR